MWCHTKGVYIESIYQIKMNIIDIYIFWYIFINFKNDCELTDIVMIYILKLIHLPKQLLKMHTYTYYISLLLILPTKNTKLNHQCNTILLTFNWFRFKDDINCLIFWIITILERFAPLLNISKRYQLDGHFIAYGKLRTRWANGKPCRQ